MFLVKDQLWTVHIYLDGLSKTMEELTEDKYCLQESSAQNRYTVMHSITQSTYQQQICNIYIY
jgi:hypothetical protein